MAKTSVTLKIAGFKDREVDWIEYGYTQATDKEGQTTGIPRGGVIKLRVKAMNDGNCELLNWMVDKSLAKDGKIEFMDSSDVMKKMKDIEFTNAYCVNYLEHWHDATKKEIDDKTLTHWELITISCRAIKVQSVTYTNEWL